MPPLSQLIENSMFFNRSYHFINFSLCLCFAAKSQSPLEDETNQLKADHNDKVRVKEVELWQPSRHDVGPTSKKLVTFALHSSRGSIKQDGKLVANETEFLRPE